MKKRYFLGLLVITVLCGGYAWPMCDLVKQEDRRRRIDAYNQISGLCKNSFVTKEEIGNCVRGRDDRDCLPIDHPLNLVVRYKNPELIEPLMRLGFGKYAEALSTALEKVSKIIPKKFLIALYNDNNQVKVSQEQLTLIYDTYHECIPKIRHMPEVDVVKELLRFGEFHQNMSEENCFHKEKICLLASLVPIAYKEVVRVIPRDERWPSVTMTTCQYIPVPGWRTKTWRAQALTVLMARHPRVGAQSPLKVFAPWLLCTIAQWIPRHMSMQDRLARRERKQQARGEKAVELAAKRRKT